MKLLEAIKVLLIGHSLCAIALSEASNESVLTIAANDSSLTTASNASNSSVTATSDKHVSDVSEGRSIGPTAPVTASNNSQHSLLTKDFVNENAPKVLVTHKSLTSVSIAFDDFKLPNYESGYVVQYRQQNGSNHTSDWRPMQANNTPFVTIKDLRPHTTYQIQVLVWEDIESKRLGLGSEIITATTEDGCLFNDTAYSVGQDFLDGCEARCTCRANAKLDCSMRFA